jgi:two-component system CheB/CheR fusion protein
MALTGKQIYVVDDDEAVRDSLKILLMTQGADVRDFDSCENFIAAYEPSTGECLILDVNLPGMSGFDLLSQLRTERILVPVILISGNPGTDMLSRARQLGAIDLLDKPVGFPRLLESLFRAFQS